MENKSSNMRLPVNCLLLGVPLLLPLLAVPSASAQPAQRGEVTHEVFTNRPRKLWIGVVRSGELLPEEVANHLFRSTGFAGGFPAANEYDYWSNGYAAEFTRELLPAEEDPTGGWGRATSCIQMSIRVYKTNFAVGEPVPVVILWRNVGVVPLFFPVSSEENYPFDVCVSLEGKAVQPKLPRLRALEGLGTGGDPTLVQPRTQWRETLRLDQIFDLSKRGNYEVSAGRALRPARQLPFTKAQSGTARFRILAKPGSSEGRDGSGDRTGEATNATPGAVPQH